MQTSIKRFMAVGIPGTHGNGQPYFADPYIAGDDVTMGGVAAIDANGNAVPYSASATTPVGIFVNPNEHVKMILPNDTYSLVVRKGDTVAVAKKGAWYVRVPTADKANWVVGAKLVYDNVTYALKVGSSDAVAEILAVGPSAVKWGSVNDVGVVTPPYIKDEDADATVALIRFL